ncbi:MAG: hypothetical protein K0U34_06950 [Alphaproteobacteria bacterium]|nr:hypothetical protein [Alphaproteobacteria bacterium]
MRHLIRAALVVAGVTAAQPVLAQWNDKAYTTRIETRPYYGATVTVESGVRVFRGIPPTRHMIINPHGATPLQLGINDTRILEKSTSTNNFFDRTSRGGPAGVGGFVAGAGFGHGKFRANGKRFRDRPGRIGVPRRRAAQGRP